MSCINYHDVYTLVNYSVLIQNNRQNVSTLLLICLCVCLSVNVLPGKSLIFKLCVSSSRPGRVTLRLKSCWSNEILITRNTVTHLLLIEFNCFYWVLLARLVPRLLLVPYGWHAHYIYQLVFVDNLSWKYTFPACDGIVPTATTFLMNRLFPFEDNPLKLNSSPLQNQKPNVNIIPQNQLNLKTHLCKCGDETSLTS